MNIELWSVLILAGFCAACGTGANPTPHIGTAPSNSASAPPGSGSAASSSGSAASQPAPHVFLIIEENRSFSTVYNNQMPWLSALGDKYGIATNYYSDEPGSLTDYLWLSSGSGESNFECNGNQCAQPVTDDNIFRALNNAGMSWKMYAESLPSNGFLGAYAGEYVKRHNPAVWYSDVVNSTQQQQNVVPFSQLPVDLAAGNLPNYSIIVPNLLDDAHDGAPAAADQWLRANITPLLNSSYFQPGGNGVLFITFDNGDGDAQGQVFTAVVGQSVIPGVKVNTPYRHENTLRTIMQRLGLKNFPGASATAAPMNEFFK